VSLVAASDVAVHFSGPLVLDGIDVKLEPGRRVGLIGRNGSGKSTLLKLFAGLLEPTRGRVSHAPGVTVGYQEQELSFVPGTTVFAHMRAGFAAAEARQERLAAVAEGLAARPEDRRLLAEYERLQAAQEAGGVYDIDRRIETTLRSLGLPESTWDQPLDGFSGGERNVIGLARVLLQRPDVLLLDEPTNHLDLDGIAWFEDFVRHTDAAVLMVSHNRHVLDTCVHEIWELDRGRVVRWAGNYTTFRRLKAEAVALQERQYKAQKKTVERLEFQARRLRDMANAYDDPGQAKRAKAMMRRAERLKQVEKPVEDTRRFGGTLKGGARHGRIALAVDGFSFSYGDRVLFEDAHLEVEYGDRVCLVGPNGSGKTTLLRQVLEHGGWENPTLRLGKAVRVGEYRQLHDLPDPRETLLDWAMRVTGLTRTPAAKLLHRFLFSADDLDRGVGTLSGGEKSRLQLARLVHGKVNFLVLDEPTNHLDLEACEQLESMLLEFEGTLLVVSHDRWFLEKLVKRVVEVQDRRLVDHRCGFEEWWRKKREAAEPGRRGALEDRATGPDPDDKEARRQEYEARKERQRERDRRRARLADVERRIAELEEERAGLKDRMAELYERDGHAEAAEAHARFETAGRDLEGLYGEWEDLAGDD